MAKIEQLFVTTLYRDKISARLTTQLAAGCQAIAQEDKAGQHWSKTHGYKGYTSYASLNDLPQRDPGFAALQKILDKQVAAFARAVQFDLTGRKLVLDSLWINILKKSGLHAPHIHPHAAISGVCYVQIPPGAASTRFEDPRLGLMMAAPSKRKKGSLRNQTFVSVTPKNGTVLLWESWLRHGVNIHTVRPERISVSFNYRID